MKNVPLIALASLCAVAVTASEPLPPLPGSVPTEEDYYRLETIPTPPNAVFEVGGLCLMADRTLMACTRRGEIWARHGAEWHRFASGLDEPMGLWPVGTNQVIIAQRPELTRVTDTDGDGEADLFETLADQWNYSGHIYEWSFGPVADRAGNLYGTLACWFFPAARREKPPYSGWELAPPAFHHPGPETAWRGWCFQVTPRGEFIPFASGLRSPNGIGLDLDDELFVTDNQGEYFAACVLHHVTRGAFLGHPNGLFWGPDAVADPFALPLEDLDRRRKLPAVVFPYMLMGQSASQPLVDDSGGAFGPFAGQMFVGDQTHSTVMRVALERVNGEYQGACFPFRRGLPCGVNRLLLDTDGSLFVGETDRGWPSVGGKHDGLQRLVWTGAMPFEIERVSAQPDGFKLQFTRPLAAADPPIDAVTVRHFRYPYHRAYGGPTTDAKEELPLALQISPQHRTLKIVLPSMVPGTVYHLSAAGLKAEDGSPLLHDTAFYTLNQVPK